MTQWGTDADPESTGRRSDCQDALGWSRRGLLGTFAAGLLAAVVPAGASASGQDREPLGEFTGVSTGGFVGFARESRQKAKENGTTIPAAAETDEAFELDGVLYDDGTWEAPEPSVPPLDTGVTEIDAELREGLDGTFDLETQVMTASGPVTVIGRDGTEIGFEVNVTTGESGDLSGDFEIDGGTLNVTLVDNEYIVDDTTGHEVIDEDLGLPATDPGENYIEIGFELEPDEDLMTALLESGGDDDSDGMDGDGNETDGNGNQTDGDDNESDGNGNETDGDENQTDGSDDDGAGFGLLAALGGLAGLGYLVDRFSATGE